MTWKKRDDNFLLWGVNVILMGKQQKTNIQGMWNGVDLDPKIHILGNQHHRYL